jgi:hypothetical protein
VDAGKQLLGVGVEVLVDWGEEDEGRVEAGDEFG